MKKLTICLCLTSLFLSGCSQEKALSPEEYLKRAAEHETQNNHQKALEEYSKVIKLVPETPEAAIAYFKSGQIYANLNRSDEAIEAYSKVIEIAPRNTDAYLMRGVTYADRGEVNEAVKDLDVFISANPNVAAGYYIRGSVYLPEKAYDKAIEDFNKAIEFNPAEPSYYYKRAIAYHDKGLENKSREDYVIAIKDLTKTIEIDPEYMPGEVYKWRADSYNSIGEYPEAIADFTRAIEINPGDAVLYNDRGNAYLRSDRYNEAKEDYIRAVDLDPEGRAGKLAYDNLELLVKFLQEKSQSPKQLTQDDIAILNSLEKEWGMNIDKSVPFIQERNYAGADVYIAKARETIQKMRDLLVPKGYDPESIDRLVAMDGLVMVYGNLNRLGAYANNPEEAIGNMTEVQALFLDTHKQLNVAEAKFHEAPPLQEFCRQLRALLNEIEEEIKRYIM